MSIAQQDAATEAAQQAQAAEANSEAEKNAIAEKNKATAAANQAAEPDNVTSFNFGNSSNAGPAQTLYYPSELKTKEGETNFVKFSFFDYVGPYTSEASAGTKV